MSGRPLAGAPFRSVRYAGTSRPSDDLYFARLHVEERQPGEIGALVRFEIDARAVLVKAERPARLEHVAAVDLREAGVVDAEHLGVTVFGDTRREAQLVRQVEFPV